jgi:hypothetical protein
MEDRRGQERALWMGSATDACGIEVSSADAANASRPSRASHAQEPVDSLGEDGRKNRVPAWVIRNRMNVS